MADARGDIVRWDRYLVHGNIDSIRSHHQYEVKTHMTMWSTSGSGLCPAFRSVLTQYPGAILSILLFAFPVCTLTQLPLSNVTAHKSLSWKHITCTFCSAE